MNMNDHATAPTTTRFPWRATLRTVVVAGLGLLPLLPEIARAADINTIPAVVSVLAVTAAIQRVISVPGVERWLRKTFHGVLSAAPPGDPQSLELDRIGRHRLKENRR